MRLRTLSEAECYTRCYGGRRDDRVSLLQVVPAAERPDVVGKQLRRLFDRHFEGRAAA